MGGLSFERCEYKYLMTSEQYSLFRSLIDKYVEDDEYCESSIRNIYYDTEDYRLVRTSLEKPVYKEKLRLRSYGSPSPEDTVFIEIKKKFGGVVYKRRIPLALTDAENYLINGAVPELPEEHRQIFKEIDYFIHFYNPFPRVFLAYERTALVGREDKELRLTFDRNIRSRRENLSLSEDDSGELLLPAGTYLLETKAEGALPFWLIRALEQAELKKMSFSKYGTVYSMELLPRGTDKKLAILYQ